MNLEQMATKDLLALHNRIAEKPAGPKTFSTRSKLVVRIEQILDGKSVDLASFRQANEPEAVGTLTQPRTEANEESKAAEAKSAGKGIGALARAILMDPVGYPHALIAEIVNAQIDGAGATAKSVRWYANDMRKKGVHVPPRQKVFPAQMGEKQSAEWLRSVRVAERTPSSE